MDRRRAPFDIKVETQGLRAVLDTSLEPDHEGKLEYLKELLQLDQYEVFTELQPGETDDGSRFRIDLPDRPQGKIGMLNDHAAAIIKSPGGGRSMHLIGAARNNMQAARNRSTSMGMDPEAAAEAALLAGAAFAINTDILITEREFLLTFTPRHRANPVSVSEALAVIGLHMRSTGWTTLRCLASYRPRIDLGWTELVQSWALLPAVLDAVSHAPASGSWPQLLRETVYRLGRMLRARDQVLLAALTVNGDRRIDVENEVEAMALSAMGAFDIVARAANIAIPLGLNPRECGLQKRAFRSTLRRSGPAAGQVADDPTVSATVDLVGNLRNTIHAEPMRPAGYSGPGSHRTEERVLIPADLANSVRESSQELGKADFWLKDFGLNELLVHPQRLTNDLVFMVATTVNALVASIQWPRDSSSQGWDHHHADDPMAPENTRRIQWLYGCS